MGKDLIFSVNYAAYLVLADKLYSKNIVCEKMILFKIYIKLLIIKDYDFFYSLLLFFSINYKLN